MKSKEVLELLQISRPTLGKYVREGLIKAVMLSSWRITVRKGGSHGAGAAGTNK